MIYANRVQGPAALRRERRERDKTRRGKRVSNIYGDVLEFIELN